MKMILGSFTVLYSVFGWRFWMKLVLVFFVLTVKAFSDVNRLASMISMQTMFTTYCRGCSPESDCCAIDDSNGTVEGVRSRNECALVCLGTTNCSSANWKEANKCDMFFYSPRNYTTVRDCTYISTDLTGIGYMPVKSVNSWIVLQQRIDQTPLFNVDWNTYKSGFGSDTENFWLGLERIYAGTRSGKCQIRFEMFNDLGQWIYMDYSSFYLDGESGLYRIHVAGYSGDPNFDLMNCGFVSTHNGMAFTTFDRDNDYNPFVNCASLTLGHGGGWWWNFCHCFSYTGNYDGVNSANVISFGYQARGESQWRFLKQSRMMMKCN